MALDHSRLEKLKAHNGKSTARCPACAEIGSDTTGNHLSILPNGAFNCIQFNGDGPDAKEHRKRIYALAGGGDAPANGHPFAPAAPPPQAQREAIDWPECCQGLLQNASVLQRLAEWRGWSADFCRVVAAAGVAGLYQGCIAFPVHDKGGRVTALHVFRWPGTTKGKAWFVNDGGNVPLVIGASSLDEVGEAHVCESQWDALSLLYANGWNGSPLAAPFLVTRGTSVHPRLATLLGGVERVVLWPQDDEPKQDGSRPSETWVTNVAHALAGTPVSLLRTDLLNVVKDWNDFLLEHGPEETRSVAREALASTRKVPLPNPTVIKVEGEPAPERDLPTPEPLPSTLPPVAPFHEAWLPRSLRDWIADIAERMQCPPDFPAVAAMIALSSIAGRRFAIQPKARDSGWIEHPHLWGMLVGRPSMMKSPAIQAVLRPLRLMEGEACREHDTRELERKAGEIRKRMERDSLAKKAKLAVNKGQDFDFSPLVEQEAEGEATPQRRFIVNDATIEALGEVLRANPNGVLLYQDELAGLLALVEKDGNASLRAFLLSAWSGKEGFTFDRIKRGTRRVEACAISVLGSIQPGVVGAHFRTAQAEGHGDDGFMQRFSLLAWPDVSEEWENIDRAPDHEREEEAMGVFRTMESFTAADLQHHAPLNASGIPVFQFAPDAQECFTEWRTALERRLRGNTLSPALEAHLGKFRKLVPALAVLTHVAEWQGRGVTLSALQRAIAWAEYLETHAARAYGARAAADADAARFLLSKLLGGAAWFGETFTARDVQRKTWRSLSTGEEARSACSMLADYGWLVSRVISATEKGGRPTHVYQINPLAKTENEMRS